MKKNLLLALCTLCLSLFCAFGLSACKSGDKTEHVDPDGIDAPNEATDKEIAENGIAYVWRSDKNGYSVSGIADRGITEIVIPSSVNNFPVTSIGIWAFKDCTSLTSVTVPNSITSIGEGAFRGCESLASVNITDLAAWCKIAFADAFSNPLSVAQYVVRLDDLYESFLYLNGALLTNLVIPDGVTEIGDYAFNGCTSFKSITIPDSVTKIGLSAFAGCGALETITVTNGNARYHSAGNCLIETKTKTLILGCKNSVIPSDGTVTSIGNEAFFYCVSLTGVTIPNCATSIGWDAFAGCSKLAYVTFQGTKAEWNSVTKGSNWNSDTGNYTIHCTDGDIVKE